jgi:hypothetical protein
VVAEIYPPMPGRPGDLWYRILLTRARGRASTLTEAKVQIERALSAFFGASAEATALRAAAASAHAAPRAAASARAGRWVECPHCEMRVPSLASHLEQVHDLVPTSQLLARQGVPRTGQSAAGWSTCPDCGVPVKKLARRRKKMHGSHPQAASPSPTPPPPADTKPTRAAARPAEPRPLIDCPDCGARVKPAKMAQHRGRCPARPKRAAKRGARQPVPSPARPRPRPSSVTGCPECGAPVQKSRLAEHRAQHAAQRSTQAYTAEARTRGEVRAGGRANVSKPRLVLLRDFHSEGKLDATRDYGQVYREHGRFGSHAAHDNYSEDSHS